jgi:gas vesicle protein
MGLIKNVAAGAIIGAAAGMMIAPQLNRHTRKRLIRSGDMMMGIVGDIYEDMMRKMK